MRTKKDIRKELIELFVDNYNSLDNLTKYLNKKYYLICFKNYKEFCSYLGLNASSSISDYTDDYILESDNYLILLFNDYRVFKGANEKDNFQDDVVICYDEPSKKIIKYYYTGLENDYLHDIDAFID